MQWSVLLTNNTKVNYTVNIIARHSGCCLKVIWEQSFLNYTTLVLSGVFLSVYSHHNPHLLRPHFFLGLKIWYCLDVVQVLFTFLCFTSLEGNFKWKNLIVLILGACKITNNNNVDKVISHSLWFTVKCVMCDAIGNEKAFIVSTVKEVICIYCTCVRYCIFIMPGVGLAALPHLLAVCVVCLLYGVAVSGGVTDWLWFITNID